jgi:acetolactate synthase-1/2/3 large subunit
MRVADYIMLRLEQAGVGHVFLVTGRGALFLTDALAKNGNLRPICNHHEQASAFSALAYAEQRSELGACLVSTGCASTNTITGVLSAWQDAVPCVFISGQNTLRETCRHTGVGVRTYGQQEADIVGIVRPITKFARMIEKPEEIFEVMDEALFLATSGRKGPVWIDVPLDLQSALIDPDSRTPGRFEPPPIGAPFSQDFAEVLRGLCQARRPVILAGGELKGPRGKAALKRVAECWKIPVTFDASATDIYGSGMPFGIGSVGSMGCSRAGSFALQNADYLVALGSRLTSIITGPDFCKFARHARVVAVDVDGGEHEKESVKIDKLIVCDPVEFLERLGTESCCADFSSWLEKCLHWKSIFEPIEPQFRSNERVDLYQLAESLSEALPDPSTIVTDSGLIEVILPSNIKFRDGLNCIHPFSQGAMGFALPGAIGAWFGRPQLVVAVIGDGSIMMNLQELETIRHHQIPLKIIVVNNNAYSIIRRRQRDLFRKRIVGTDASNGVSCPDFSKVAACFGFNYSRIERPSELTDALKSLFSRNGPEICEIMGRENQEYIEVGHARSATDNRFVRRPLEDQAPFLSRELFLSEMLIDPIDQ